MEYKTRMKANLSWLQKLVFTLAWKFSSIDKIKGLIRKFGDVINSAGCVVTEWKLKLTGQLFTPTVCRGFPGNTRAKQLRAAAIHLCQLIKNCNLLVCEGEGGWKKTNPPLIEYNTCRPLCVLSARHRRGDRLFCLRFVVSLSSSCVTTSVRASSAKTSSVSPFWALWGGKKHTSLTFLSIFFCCILREDSHWDRSQPQENLTDRKCDLKLLCFFLVWVCCVQTWL